METKNEIVIVGRSTCPVCERVGNVVKRIDAVFGWDGILRLECDGCGKVSEVIFCGRKAGVREEWKQQNMSKKPR